MRRCLIRIIPMLLVAVIHSDVAAAREEFRTLFLSTYSEDFKCSSVVYARIDNVRCTDTSVCALNNDSDGSFHDSEMTACIRDRDEFLKSAFRGAAYLTVELYPENCNGRSYNTRSFVADGNCHPYALNNHFKVVQSKNGTTSVFSAEAGCDATHDSDWNEEWRAVSNTEVNTEACITDGRNTWKSYYVAGTDITEVDTSASTTDGSSTPPGTAAPVTTAPPDSITPTPTTTSTTLASSSRGLSHSIGVSAAALFINVIF